MAHYANDCWDGEVETSYGWVECVGLADRAAFDLNAHAKMSKSEMTAHERFAEPRMVDTLKVIDWWIHWDEGWADSSVCNEC